jgi:hypothetical protein
VTRDEIASRLRAGGIALAFDTNAIWSMVRLTRICDAMKRHNEHVESAGRAPVRLVVSTIAHAEKLFDLKQQWREKFDFAVILAGLKSLGLDVQAFEEDHALETAVRLGERYRNDSAWRRAKRARCLHCLGLPPDTPSASGTGRACGATIDWLIGGHARAVGCVLVTDDNDPELGGFIERVGLDTLEDALQEVLSGPV